MQAFPTAAAATPQLNEATASVAQHALLPPRPRYVEAAEAAAGGSASLNSMCQRRGGCKHHALSFVYERTIPQAVFLLLCGESALRLLVNGCGTVARKDEIPRRLQRGQEGDTTSLN